MDTISLQTGDSALSALGAGPNEDHYFVADFGTGATRGATSDVTRVQNASTSAALPTSMLAVGTVASAGLPVLTAPSLADQLLRFDPAEEVTVIIELPEVAFDFAQLAQAQAGSPQARDARIQGRKVMLSPLQQPVIGRLRAMGATNVTALWVTNRLIAKMPAGSVLAVSTWPNVEQIFLDSPTRAAAYSMIYGRGGIQYLPEMRTQQLLDAGITAAHGNSWAAGAPVQYVVLEVPDGEHANTVTRRHANWMDDVVRTGGCGDCSGWDQLCVDTTCTEHNRLTAAWDCDDAACRLSSSSGNNEYDTHGGMVTSLLMGSVDEGQNPQCSSAACGGGQAIDAQGAYFLTKGNGASVVVALEKILENYYTADVINFSADVAGDFAGCYPDYNPDGLAQTIKAVTDAGILFVSVAGNEGSAPGVDGCNLSFPCSLQDVLCVGAMDTTHHLFYNRHNGSGHGPVRIEKIDGTMSETSGVDIMAPGTFSSLRWGQEYPSAEPAEYAITGRWGTSIAAPLVAGGAGLLRHAWTYVHHAKMNSRELLVNMLLMGDGYQQGVIDEPWRESAINGVSALTGTGSLKLRAPISESLTPPWGWGYRSFVLHEDELVKYTVGDSGPESALLTEWRWALAYFDTSLKGTSRINIWVEDVCNKVTLASDFSGQLRKRIILRDDWVRNRCLVMNVWGRDIPKDGVLVVSADAYHSTPEYW